MFVRMEGESGEGPLNATVEKQNCGVSCGGGNVWVMVAAGMAFGVGASTREGFCQRNSARLNPEAMQVREFVRSNVERSTEK